MDTISWLADTIKLDYEDHITAFSCPRGQFLKKGSVQRM